MNAKLEELSNREYFELDSIDSCLDGHFTSSELRLIADEMDRLSKEGDKMNDDEFREWFLEGKPIEFGTKADMYEFYLEELKKAFDDIIWMALRYANNRHTYAPGVVRKACRIRAKIGDFHLKPDNTLEDFEGGHTFKHDNLRDLLEKYR